MTSNQKFKLIVIGVWAFLTLIFGLMCGIKWFEFDASDFGMVEVSISVVLGVIGIGEHLINK